MDPRATSNTAPSRAILVGVDFGKHDFQESLSELALLTTTAGSLPVHTLTGRRARPDPALFIGSGKAEELKEAADALDADVVVFNHALSPAQQRNLERFLQRHVIDRTGLILDIFGQRAQSHVGKVQVELAQVQYRASRLVRAWSHLERQKGGIGMRGGPGERQLELDRRMLDERAKRLKSDLSRLQRQHSTQRRARARNDTLSISLVGYTNAGKSTLFNALTKAGAYAANQLFATLDTTSRRLFLDGLGNVVLSDTVGFIRDLPTQLVAAFRATLDETVHADLLLHVVDASSPVRHEQIEQVNRVLAEINALDIPQIVVMNKIDAAPELLGDGPRIERDAEGIPTRVFLSAREGLGLDALREAVVEVAQWLASRPPEPQPYDPRLDEVAQSDDAGDGDHDGVDDGVADEGDDADAADPRQL
ncbi:putative GTPase [Cupriavidus taiwanensis]|uniref:GTPase HflX n=1 Tax=Cupriavidus taiwanensis TaxID=164546 RepID=A0A375DZ48_9BURK|nr:GTPase HflX [Cupriavidus taiwanensis]SOZ16917.1 putative GTPase [Cupriavidus taiwanensis]SOZ22658.1 putative GTPase [Cupriavidus taiwanensis]SOZ42232.1 putative GTPase [Cupriavidus taiwanensis]SOZ52689.1 putative GTPase [Cupriavidus taiwanensis]SOZ54185.1 putative GTPase [Cupriavidus taiwanensis]